MLFLQEDVILIIISLNVIKNNQVADLLKITDHARCLFIILNKDLNTSKLWANIQKDYYLYNLYFSCLNLYFNSTNNR